MIIKCELKKKDFEFYFKIFLNQFQMSFSVNFTLNIEAKLKKTIIFFLLKMLKFI